MIESTTARADGHAVELITLTSGSLRAVVTNLGARLMELHVPDQLGVTADVVLQRPTLGDVAVDDNYMGSTAGRYANRVRDGRLTIDGRAVQLSLNEGTNHLHGGVTGFDRYVWTTRVDNDANEVTFSRVSPNGEEGYPGTMTVNVTYALSDSALSIDITATTDATTVANIVHHSYFNLAGHESGTILDHLLQIRSSFYTPVDDDLLPTGEVRTVTNTPFDFRTATPIGTRLADVEHSGAGRVTSESAVGYDHNWALEGVGMREVLVLSEPESGRTMTMSTNQPGVQVYVGGYLEGVTGKAPVDVYPAFAGVTMETQTFPDAVNHSHFPQAELKAGETYRNSMRFDFSTS